MEMLNGLQKILELSVFSWRYKPDSGMKVEEVVE
jgi:hypothetical protein